MLREVPTLKAELIVVRGKDDVVRAFHNTCAHRGVPVVHQKKGTSATFRCPYHSWLYGADGKLRSIPAQENFPCVDKANSGLVPVNLDIWNGFIFVNFADEPEQSLVANSSKEHPQTTCCLTCKFKKMCPNAVVPEAHVL